MNYKKYIFSIAVFSATILCAITLTSIFLTLLIAHNNSLKFCFSPGCFDFAEKAFQEPIKIFKIGVAFGAYAFTAIGAATAILTYVNSVKAEKNNRHFQKHSEFKAFTSGLVARQNSGIRQENFNANKYYSCLFPLSAEAYFIPSEPYDTIINNIERQIEETQVNFIPGDIRSIEEHCRNMLEYFHSLGIAVEEPTEETLMMLEPKIFSFIDNINQQFTNIEVSLRSKSRDYIRSIQ
ncbi:retron Ec48 family effector membrane protein [Pseudomonas lurida]|uniref:retron Ec48 family effector membrane protein n=1 Tax=Pseudomonas lurida TaxID=244566 RepID=UPI0011AE5244|nr:retron Ec48 family effector membrane protein [Pseudomonas lurida]